MIDPDVSPLLDVEVILIDAPLLGPDLESALLALGAKVRIRAASEIGLESLRDARQAGVDAVVSINHSPELALLCSLAQLRYVSWTIDPVGHRRWAILGGTRPRSCHLLVHRKALVEPLLAMGYTNVRWLPLACASRRFGNGDGTGLRRGEIPLFVGSSLQDERRILTEACTRWGIAEAVDAVDAMLGELAKACLWDRSFHGFARVPEAVPPSLKKILPKVEVQDLAEVLDAGLAWHFRRALVGFMARCGTEIKGDSGWRDLAGDRWTGPLRNGQEMTERYSSAAVNLDAPRLHQREIATLRAFDAMGSGGLFACETGTELDGLFRAGQQFLTWSDQKGLEELIEAAKHRDPQLDAVAHSGFEAVRRLHSLDDRARQILTCVRDVRA
jgi:hypothetical protein